MKSIYNRILILVIISLTLSTLSCEKKGDTQTQAQQPAEKPLDSLTLELERINQDDKIAGFGVAIVNAEGSIYSKGFGYANKAQGKAYTKNTIQNIASISKTFLGIALLKAQEMGKLQLDDPINKYLPFEVYNPKFKDIPITIRHLSTHTSSIVDSDFYNLKSYVLKDAIKDSTEIKGVSETFNSPESAVSMEVFLQNCLTPKGEWYTEKTFLESAPGQTFEYSNVGAALAAYVLVQAVEMDYPEFSKKHILDPLGMTSSGWNFESIDLNQHTILYQVDQTPIPFYRLVTYPDGGMITSVDDLGKYLTELIKGYSGEGTLLSKEGYDELFTPQLSASHFTERDSESAYNDEYNMGIFMGMSAKGNIGHTGGDPGVSSLMFFNAESKTGQILMINTGLDDFGYNEFVKIWETTEKYR